MFKVSGLLLLAAVLLMNVLLGVFLFQDFGGEALASGLLGHPRGLVMGALLILLPALYLRYFKYTDYERVHFRFQTRSHPERNGYHFASLAYIVLSLASTIAYAVYCGGVISGFWQ